MDPIITAALGFAGVIALILLHVPVGVALGLAGIVGFGLLAGFGPAVTLLVTEPSAMLINQDLAVLPLFLLMGGFAGAAGLAEEGYRLAHAFVGHRRGGLALATIGGCAAFAAICGSSVATTATMGRLALPEMRAHGYAPSLAAGSVAAGGTLGFMIPPSIAMVVYGVLTAQPIGELFMAGVVPGAISVLLYFAATDLYVRWKPESGPPGARTPWPRRWAVLGQSWGIFALFGTVIGGLYAGVFIPSEAAAVGAVGAFLFALLRGRLAGGVLWRVLGEAAANTALVYIILMGAAIFSYFIVIAELPAAVVGHINDLQVAPGAVLLLLLGMYLVLGSLLDPFAAMVLTLPVVFPLVNTLGFDPIWWGVVMVMVIEIGMITPPIGLNVFVLKSVAGELPLSTIFKGIVPFLCADLVRLTLLILFPALALWLPRTMG